ncbi:MAG: metallophosphoesterase family protein [Isosphaeraceae bacterium]
MATYFCSDPHAFHGNIMKYCRRTAFMTESDLATFLDVEARGPEALRAFRLSRESIDTMNQALVANVNAVVAPEDTLWCLGDWCFGKSREYLANARWFRDQIHCRTVNIVWGNHDDRVIRDLFDRAVDQIEIEVDGVPMTLNHYPMLTWNGQHRATAAQPNVHLYGHVHAIYQRDPSALPIRDADAWAALDVGFDGHDYQVWSVPQIMDALRTRLIAFESLKRSRNQFDPFRGRGHVGVATV